MAFKRLSLEAYIQGVLSSDISILGRAISLVESTKPSDQTLAQALIEAILPNTGASFRIGITGVPGVGKSTFIEHFGLYLLQQQKKIAVLAIDPSSSISKGSILGDKTRMETLATQNNVFIRPSASGASLGGISYKTYEAMLLCEAAGFDTILIETVGVGQSETEVAQICDFFLLLMLSGAGDELQGIKRGIMEMADALVLSKADSGNLEKAKIAAAEYARALHFLPHHPSGWQAPTMYCSAYENLGFDKIFETLNSYETHTKQNGYFAQKRKDQQKASFHRLLQQYLQQLFLNKEGIHEKIKDLESKIEQGSLSPYAALQLLF